MPILAPGQSTATASPEANASVRSATRTALRGKSTTKIPSARCAPARSVSRGCWPPVITAPLLLPGPAPARHGEARSRSYPGPPGASFCDCTPLPGNPYARTPLAGAAPATRCKRRPAVGRPGRTQPPCGHDRTRRRQTRRPWASGPAVAALAPACRARQYPARRCRLRGAR